MRTLKIRDSNGVLEVLLPPVVSLQPTRGLPSGVAAGYLDRVFARFKLRSSGL
jgi:hypothetical protein